MWGLLAAFLLTALITAYLTFVTVREVFNSRQQPEGLPVLSLNATATPGVTLSHQDLNTPLQAAGMPTPQPWDGASRVNLLLMGLDYRDWEAEGPSRTDTMILFTIDPETRSAGMLSIPRDLWVYIPGFDYGKINTAHYLGEAYQVNGGGPGLALQTVQLFLGIPIQYYAEVDFYAFERFINEIGGVEIDVPEEISVDPLGPGNTVILQPGMQILDGPTALAYARNRDTAGGDFDRAQRQQQVILAIRDRILSFELLPTLIGKTPTLYKDLRSSINTNLTLEQLIRLAWLAQQIPPENITRSAIGTDQVTITISPDGLDILQPDPDAIRLLRDQVFTTTGPIQPAATAANPEALRQAESATVSVLNATYTPGLAAETSDYLRTKGINVVLIDNAQEAAAATVIIDYSGKPYTVQYLVQLLSIDPSNIFSRFDPNRQVDIAILLGDDWASNNTLP
jgi:LCP family protein required for cell wall assembly